eukprot:2374370-Rhodomonas_salina.2
MLLRFSSRASSSLRRLSLNSAIRSLRPDERALSPQPRPASASWCRSRKVLDRRMTSGVPLQLRIAASLCVSRNKKTGRIRSVIGNEQAMLRVRCHHAQLKALRKLGAARFPPTLSAVLVKRLYLYIVPSTTTSWQPKVGRIQICPVASTSSKRGLYCRQYGAELG